MSLKEVHMQVTCRLGQEQPSWLPVVPGNSTLLQGSSTMSSPQLLPRADICIFSKVIQRLRSAQCTQSLLCSFSPEMVQAAPGGMEEV